jgi:hypothetical protein
LNIAVLNSSTGTNQAYIYKNGTAYISSQHYSWGSERADDIYIDIIMYLTTTDYIDFRYRAATGATANMKNMFNGAPVSWASMYQM